MTNYKNVARSLGLNGCKAVIGGGFNAAYQAHKSVVSDSAARALRAACLDLVVAAMAKAKAATTAAVVATPAAAVPLVNAVALVERLIAHLGACVRHNDTIPGCRKALGYVSPATKGCAVTARFEAAEGVIASFARMGYANDGGVATKRLINSLARTCVRTGKEACDVVQDWIIKNDATKASALLASLYDAALRERAEQEEYEAMMKEEEALEASGVELHHFQTIAERKAQVAERKAQEKAARKAAKWAAKATAVAIKKGKIAAVEAVVEVVAEPVVETKAVASTMMTGFSIQDAMFCLNIDHALVLAELEESEAQAVQAGAIVSYDHAYQVAA